MRGSKGGEVVMEGRGNGGEPGKTSVTILEEDGVVRVVDGEHVLPVEFHVACARMPVHLDREHRLRQLRRHDSLIRDAHLRR